MSTLQSVRYCRGDLQVLDQLLLPLSSSFVPVRDVDQAWDVIKNMQVRGAPAIAIVGCLSLAVELSQRNFDSTWELREFVSKKLDHLVTARPTAVNMVDAAKMLTSHVQEFAEQNSLSSTEMKERIIKKIEGMLKKDVENNMLIGKHGADHILEHYNNQPVQILTHCNTGSLATAGYGTALGVVRKLHEKKKLDHVYCTETRPYNQGSRLTAYELVYENMPATLICDSMAAALLQQKKVSAVVVGADRVVANGDTANKIGTYQLSLVAKYHRVPFYVAVPTTSCDFELKDGSQIVIEERPHKEMISIGGAVIAAPGIGCWNPAFDVTPAELITGGIITEFGVFHPGELKQGVQTLKKTLV